VSITSPGNATASTNKTTETRNVLQPAMRSPEDDQHEHSDEQDRVQLGRSEQAEERSEEGRHPPLSIPSEWRNCEQVPERRVAQAVDESGLDTVWINERLTFPPGAAASLPRAEVETTMRSLDPLATLAFLAAATKQIALGTAVLNLPFRPALVTAKWLATVQDLSGGRVRIGVGTGWMDEEFRALGLDPKRRGTMTDESLALLHRCFEDEVVEVNGQEIVFQPRPVRPPIYVGGWPPYALRRAVRFGDGWIPAGIEPTELKPAIAQLRELSEAAGRRALEVVAMKTLPLA